MQKEINTIRYQNKFKVKIIDLKQFKATRKKTILSANNQDSKRNRNNKVEELKLFTIFSSIE